MGFDIYGNRLKPGHCEVHPDVPEEWPCHVCIAEDRMRNQPCPEPPEPTEEEICEYSGHPYDGDDEQGGRCYCGKVRYPEGGPKNEEVTPDATD